MTRALSFLVPGVVLVVLLAGCGGGGGGPSGPFIVDLNNATTPASAVDLVIEINGSGFGSTPGQVRFAQGANEATVFPDPSGWADDNVLSIVPGAGSLGLFTIPGTVTVTVLTAEAASNAAMLDLVEVPAFSNGDVVWATTTALPVALRGHRAAGIEDAGTAAWIVVTGGNDGTQNVADVRVNTLAQDGQLGPTWTSGPQLPSPRAHHAMVVAHPGNSPVAQDARFVYVIGGQQAQADTPGGTDTVYRSGLTPATGAMTSWQPAANLPLAIQGAAATIYNGYIHIVGGLKTDGTPSASVWSAKVHPDGSLGAWQTGAYPMGLSFTSLFGFGGHLYVLGGDNLASTDPNDQGVEGVDEVRYAVVRRGVLGTWDPTTQLGKRRKKHTTWMAFGQVLSAEGVYQGAPGSQELERNVIQSDGQLSSWNNITSGSNEAGADVYNAADFVSPLRPANQGPRFLLLGGQAFSPSPPGALSSAVYYNTAP